jgi:hypothetical protein
MEICVILKSINYHIILMPIHRFNPLPKKEQEAIQRRNNAAGGTGQPMTMLYIDTCTSPQPNGNYQAGVGGYAINPPEPQIEDFVQDAQCYANTECEGDYNHQYETCGGKVLTTTRCFANCVGDAK